ncbi:MAG: penicillin-binding protein 2 [Actinomycetota bacterium]
MAVPKVEARARVLLTFSFGLLVALLVRLWFLQVLTADDARAAAARNALRLVPLPAPRGRILDVNGEVLVSNRLSLDITVNRQELGDDRESVLYELSRVLEVPASELVRRLEDVRYFPFTPIPIATDVSRAVAYYVLEHREELPGVDVRKTPVRVYARDEATGEVFAPHVVGYLGEISADQLEDPAWAGYRSGDVIGKAGVESVYESALAGENGFVSYRIDATGRNLGEFGRRDPDPGDDLVLTIDRGTQAVAEESLSLGIEHARQLFDPNTESRFVANAGAVIVMDADTGAIRALASYPSFDPSLFAEGLSNQEYEQKFGAATGFPLLDRALQGEYPPGSTYKPWILLSALKRGIVTTDRGYPCPGAWSVPGDTRLFRNWTRADSGTMSLATSLSESCDTIYYPIGYEYWRAYYPPPNADGIPGNDDEEPREPLQRDLRAIGFGRPTGIDLPGEYDGRVPDAGWKLSVHQRYPQDFPYGDWVPGDFVNMSIGQGDTLITPLQMARAYGALMNGGRLCLPRLLAEVRRSDGTVVERGEPNCRRKVPFSEGELAYVRDALEATVREGTAAGAFAGFPFGDVWIAGKTGTAQVFNRQDFSWFVGMAASGNRRYVVLSVVEQGGHGSTTAAPIARRVIEGIFGLPLSGIVSGGATD